MRRLFILGFPGLYGGAGVELHHQIHLWHKAFPELELHIIPTMNGVENEPLYQEMLDLGITIHESLNFEAVTKDDALINFCSATFWTHLEKIHEITNKIIWVNCMTYLFEPEKALAHKNLVSLYLYQRPQIRDLHQNLLEKMGAKANFEVFVPYFNDKGWEFSVKDQEFTNIGRISRQDADKFAKNTLHIYEYITSPKFKRGHFLGFGKKSEDKIGKPFGWIKTYENHKVFPVKKFYDTVDFIVQPTDTNENWPRIGFESMFSGKPLVVDDRGGWKFMIEHKKTGFLCKNERDFIYWGTRLSFEPELRQEIALNAWYRAKEMSSFEVSSESWSKIFDKAYA